MDYLSLLLAPASWPSGAWEAIIKVFSGVGNFGLAIILLTLAIKILMLPIDLWQRSVGRKMSLQQAEMQPEIDKIKAKYKDPNLVQQKTAEVYKKHNVSPMGSCGGMLVYMFVTLFVFITLFNSLGNISRTSINYEYYQLRTEYATVYQTNLQETSFDTELYPTVEDYAKATAQQAVADKYETIREGFLSIKNIYRPDNNSSVFPTAGEFISTTGTNFVVIDDASSELNGIIVLSTDKNQPYVDLAGNIYAVPSENAEQNTATKTLTIDDAQVTYNVIYGDTAKVTENKSINKVTIETAQAQFKTDFETVTAGINQKYDGVWNGYLVLIILAGVVTFLSQFLSQLGVKAKNKQGQVMQAGKSKWMMGLILSVVMIMFTVNYTSLFALYIVTNSILSIIFNIFINLTLNKVQPKIDNKKKNKDVVVADYVRVD